MAGLDEGAPLFSRSPSGWPTEIADGGLAEGDRVPSTNELAAFYRINPATAAKGINVLTDDGLLEKRRGIGMFVAAGARARLLGERRKRFAERYIEPMVAEADRLGIDADELVAMIRAVRQRAEEVSRHDTGDLGGRPDPPLPRPARPRRRQRRHRGPSITGLLGRNGAGKTTLLRIIAGQEFPSAGRVAVFGASPVENDAVLRRMVLVREDQALPDFKVRQPCGRRRGSTRTGAPSWPRRLVADFELPPNRAIKKLSRGMRSALGIVIGLAARAEVTLFDEPYAGLDAVARQLFYDRLLADYAEHPRTVLLSTHLIDEAAELLERVLMIDHGRIVLDAAADDVRGSATSGERPGARRGRSSPPGGRSGTGGGSARRSRSWSAGALDDGDRARARALHLDLEPLSLQQVMVHAAGRGRADDTRRRGQAHDGHLVNVARYHLVDRSTMWQCPGRSWRSSSSST